VADVFVSYSRRDAEFVRRLAESIAERGKDVWLDTEGIADTEIFPEAIKHAIEGADAFLFVITPASVASTYCENEVEYARDMQKRIVPVLRTPVADGELPPEIRDRNWIPFTSDEEFDASLGRLVTALDTDIEAAKAHTRWLLKALEWHAEKRDRSFLLRGSELKAAEAWLAASPEGADPSPTPLQREYLLASREGAARRQRVLVGASLAVAAVAIGLLIFALISRSQAVSAQVSAQSAADAEQSQAELPDDPEIALVLGVRAVREKATPKARFALREALDASPLERAFATVSLPGSCNADGAGLAVALSPTGTQFAEGSCNGRLALLRFANGQVLHADRISGGVVTLAYSPDGALLAVGTTTSIVLVNTRTGAVVAQRSALGSSSVRIAGPSPGITALAFSPDGSELAANDIQGVKLWSVPGLHGRQLASDRQAGGTILFANGGHQLIAGGFDIGFNVYALPNGRLLRQVIPAGAIGAGSSTTLTLSPNGGQLAVGYMNQFSSGVVAIYSTRTWKQQYLLATVHNVAIQSLAFSADGGRLAVGAADGTAGVWSLPTREQLVAYDGATAAVNAVDFTPAGNSVLTASNDGTVRLWRTSGAEQVFIPLAANIDAISVTARLLLVTANDNQGRLYLYSYRMPRGELLGRTLIGSQTSTNGVLSSDGRIGVLFTPPNPSTGVPVQAPVRVVDVATRRVIKKLPALKAFQAALSPDDARLFLRYQGAGIPNGLGDMEVVNLATGHATQLQPAYPCGYTPGTIAFSGNDSRVAAGYFCGYAVVWSARTGRIVREVKQGGQVSDVDLSPDGSRLLVSSWDSRATIWSVSSGHPLEQLIGHTRGLNGASFAAGGSEVVTTALDDTARVWNAYTGQQLRVLSFTNFQGTLAVSPSGALFALGENAVQPAVDDVVRVFETCPGCESAPTLLREAQPHLTPYLTTLEQTVLGG
jgi:WD40 repeat protein